MKATMPQLKKKINAIADQWGFAFAAKAPHFVNATRIQAIKEAILQVKEEGEANPELRYEITDKQLKSLANWVVGLEQKYL